MYDLNWKYNNLHSETILLVDVGCIAGPDRVVLGQLVHLDHLVHGQVA